MSSVKKSYSIIFLIALLVLTGVSSTFDIANNVSMASTATTTAASTEITAGMETEAASLTDMTATVARASAGTARPTSATSPQRLENYILVNKLIRQSCDSLVDSDLVECNVYFDAKNHSLSNDPAQCFVFGYSNYTLASAKCAMRVPANPCLQRKDFSWMSRCMKIYYADAFSLNKTQVFESDNVKIGSFRIPSADFVNPALFFKETYGVAEMGTFTN